MGPHRFKTLSGGIELRQLHGDAVGPILPIVVERHQRFLQFLGNLVGDETAVGRFILGHQRYGSTQPQQSNAGNHRDD